MILKDLDEQSLIKSMEAKRKLDKFLSNDRIYWIRVTKTVYVWFEFLWIKCYVVSLTVLTKLTISLSIY